MLRLLEPHQLPGEAAIRRLVDAAAGLDGVSRILLAGTCPDLHRVRRRDRERAHRDYRVVVEDRTEGHAGIGGLPDAAAGGSDEEGLRRARDAGNVCHAPFEVGWTDGSPAEAGECEGIESLCLCRDRNAREGDAGEEWKEPGTMHTHSQGVGRMEWKRYSYGASPGSVEAPVW